MSYKLRIDSAAGRELRQLDPQNLQDVVQVISALKEDPRPPGCKMLTASKARGWRVRAGKYRVLYLIDDSQNVVNVYAVGLRDRVYKKR